MVRATPERLIVFVAHNSARTNQQTEIRMPVDPWKHCPCFLIGVMTCLTLSVAARVAASTWTFEMVKGPFVIHADYAMDPNDPLFRELVQLQSDIQRQLSIGALREPIDVYLFEKKSTYVGYMKTYFPHVSPRRAMFVKSNSPGNVFAYKSRELPIDLRHECTHAILHSCMAGVPLWLDEGLAEYYEVPSQDRIANNPHYEKIRPKFYWRKTPDLKRLESIASLDQMGSREYREAWAWVHYMLHGPTSANQVLKTFLYSLQSGQVAPPISDQLTAQSSDIARSFQKHFKRTDLR